MAVSPVLEEVATEETQATISYSQMSSRELAMYTFQVASEAEKREIAIYVKNQSDKFRTIYDGQLRICRFFN